MDFGLSPDEIEEILSHLRKDRQSNGESLERTNSVGKEEHQSSTYGADVLKMWIDSAKNNDIASMQDLLNTHTSLLNAKQSGIGNSALHWAAFKDNTQVISLEKKN